LFPQGELEAVFAERIVLATWRLRRVVRLEAAVIRSQQASLSLIAPLDTTARRLPDTGPLPVSLRSSGEEPTPEVDVHAAMVRDANGTNQLERLRRYEVTLERSLLSSVHELERLQGRRTGQDTPAPAVLDVNVRSHE
jgi:hypothetical protein